MIIALRAGVADNIPGDKKISTEIEFVNNFKFMFNPAQRFFIGFAQWDCSNTRPEEMRLRVLTDPHSPSKYRINGVVVNMPEFANAFSCKAGQPMVNPPEKVCKVW